MSIQSAKKQSQAYQLYQQVQDSLQAARANSRIIQLVQLNRSRNIAETQNPQPDTTADTRVTDKPDKDTTAEKRTQSPFKQSKMYQSLQKGNKQIRASWLYQWLTKEPDPDVIVIDLRETRSVGPILDRIDRAVTALTPAFFRSTVSRSWYRAQRRVQDRPIQMVSFGVIGIAVLGLFLMATAATVNVAGVLVLVVMLILALRGTQSQMTLDELQETRWYSYLARIGSAFVPPDPPENTSQTQESQTVPVESNNRQSNESDSHSR